MYNNPAKTLVNNCENYYVQEKTRQNTENNCENCDIETKPSQNTINNCDF